MIGERPKLICKCPFFYLAKYDGDRGPRPPPTGDEARDYIAYLQADLIDPACVEIVVGGDSLPNPIVWRK